MGKEIKGETIYRCDVCKKIIGKYDFALFNIGRSWLREDLADALVPNSVTTKAGWDKYICPECIDAIKTACEMRRKHVKKEKV